jgi:hypothetical protein
MTNKNYWNLAKKDGLQILLIILVISSVFLWFYWGSIRGGVPVAYKGDAIGVLERIRHYAQGEGDFIVSREISRLNAPEQGNWSDYPTDKLPYAIGGFFARFLGVAQGSTANLLLFQVLAGVMFYCCGRPLGMERAQLIAGGILFGLAPFAFIRNINHLSLSAYWHLPVMVLTLMWLWGEPSVSLSRKVGLLLGCGCGFLSGQLNAYYLGIFLVLLTMVLPGGISSRGREALIAYIAILISCISGFLAANADTFIRAATHGWNHAAVSRDLWWMTKFGLFLPDLLIPRDHFLPRIQQEAWKFYYLHVPSELSGESQTAYVGAIAVIGLLVMTVGSVIQISMRAAGRVSPFFWLAVSILLFALPGGVNYLLGACGIQLLRGTNRYSILLACVALYYLCSFRLPQRCPRWLVPTLLIPVTMLGIIDQIPQLPSWEKNEIQEGSRAYSADSHFFPELEKMLPKGAMVFDLPVKDYPESGPVYKMDDYEHLRPLLHTTSLRFSYGTVKGRGDVEWQKVVSGKIPADFVRELQGRNFAAVLVNRRAYEDQGEIWKRKMEAVGCILLAKDDDFFVFSVPRK